MSFLESIKPAFGVLRVELLADWEVTVGFHLKPLYLMYENHTIHSLAPH